MGTWGTGIYSSDTAQDLRDDCQEIYSYTTPEEGLEILKKEYPDYFNDKLIDENYASFWYAFADWHWKHGILSEEYRVKVLDLLEKKTGIEEWKESAKASDVKKRFAVLEKLKNQLNSEMPPIKMPKEKLERPIHKAGDIVIIKAYTDYTWCASSFYHKRYLCDEKLRLASEDIISPVIGNDKYMAFLCIGKAKMNASRYFPNLYHEYSIYAFYDFLSDFKPTAADLQRCGFLPRYDYEVTERFSSLDYKISPFWSYAYAIYPYELKRKTRKSYSDMDILHLPEEANRFYSLLKNKLYSSDYENTFEFGHNNEFWHNFIRAYEVKDFLEQNGCQIDNLLNPDIINPEFLTTDEIYEYEQEEKRLMREEWERELKECSGNENQE